MPETILIVDDDPVQRRLLEAMIRRFGYEAIAVEGGDAALKRLLGAGAPQTDAVVLDLVMPDLDGLGVLARLKEAGVSVPVIVQTAHGGIDNVISAMRAGAADFVVKPAGPERLQVSLRNALAANALETEFKRLKRSRAGTLTFKDVITRSPHMQAALRTAQKAAASDIAVLLEGESGVGKELIARAIHGSGARRAKPFVAVNCGAMPETLVESILFGHEKGAFTGATERHPGKFVKVDVRIISATNRNLIADVKAGRFREVLFYRLHVFPLLVPPLRTRREDVPDLARHFFTRFAAEEGKRVRTISPEALS